MQNIYIIDETISSKKNGIGAFIKELIYCFKNSKEVTISLIRFNTNYQEFCIETNQTIKRMNFPIFGDTNFMKYPSLINIFLRLYIKDSPNNIFFFSHSPCEELVQCVKKSHPLSKLIFIIHDLCWTRYLLGDDNKLKFIINKRHWSSIKKKHSKLLMSFDKETRLYGLMDGIVCLSSDTLDVLKDIYKISENKIFLIPNGLKKKPLSKAITYKDRLLLRNELKIKKEDIILLFVGRSTISKGITPLLNSFKLILNEYSNVKLVIVGNIPQFNKLDVSLKDITMNIAYTGHINRNELATWYKVADIGIIPSYTEQCTFVGIEMLMHGLPIVASNGYGVRNMFIDGVNCKIAKIENRNNDSIYSNNLTQAILSLISSKELREKLSKGAQDIFRNKYSIKYMKAGYKQLINSLY